jgi:hypothetical protein
MLLLLTLCKGRIKLATSASRLTVRLYSGHLQVVLVGVPTSYSVPDLCQCQLFLLSAAVEIISKVMPCIFETPSIYMCMYIYKVK